MSVMEDIGLTPKDPMPKNQAPKVPWRGLKYEQFPQELLDQLEAHIATLTPEKAAEYRLYLHQHCGFPKHQQTEG